MLRGVAWRIFSSALLLASGGCADMQALGDRYFGPPPAHQAAYPRKTVKPATASPGVAAPESGGEPIALIGQDEEQVRALLGQPSEEEAHTPGKTWRYRRGRCALDVALYPDVHSRIYRTLTYEVTSDDNTDAGKRLCTTEFQSLARLR